MSVRIAAGGPSCLGEETGTAKEPTRGGDEKERREEKESNNAPQIDQSPHCELKRAFERVDQQQW